MKDGFEEDKLNAINKAFKLILKVLARYIGKILIEKDKNSWWQKYVLNKLKDENTIRNLPKEGSNDDCIKSLDIPACLNIIETNWRDVFRGKMDDRQRTWAHALHDIRNYYEAHYNIKTLENTSDEDISLELAIMVRFMRPIDPEVAERISEMRKTFEKEFTGRINTESERQLILLPDDEKFKENLLKTHKANWTLFYEDGKKKSGTWNAKNFTESSSVRGNISSGYLRGWKKKKIIKAIFEVKI